MDIAIKLRNENASRDTNPSAPPLAEQLEHKQTCVFIKITISDIMLNK